MNLYLIELKMSYVKFYLIYSYRNRRKYKENKALKHLGESVFTEVVLG